MKPITTYINTIFNKRQQTHWFSSRSLSDGRKSVWVICSILVEVLEFVCHQRLIVGSTSIGWLGPCLWLWSSWQCRTQRIIPEFVQVIAQESQILDINWTIFQSILNWLFFNCGQTLSSTSIKTDSHLSQFKNSSLFLFVSYSSIGIKMCEHCHAS